LPLGFVWLSAHHYQWPKAWLTLDDARLVHRPTALEHRHEQGKIAVDCLYRVFSSQIKGKTVNWGLIVPHHQATWHDCMHCIGLMELWVNEADGGILRHLETTIHISDVPARLLTKVLD
jgi:hypothetical protein